MRRLVLLHTFGRLSGLCQIQGLYPEGQPVVQTIDDVWGQAVLAKVEPGYVLYRAVLAEQPSGAAPLGPSRPSGAA